MGSSFSIILILVLYIGVMLLVARYFKDKDSSQEEFLLGSKKIPGWVLSLSERSTTESAWLVLGASGFVYSTGMSSIWLMVGSVLGAIIAWAIFAKPYMENQVKYQTLTTPGILAGKFEKQGRILRLLLGLMVVFFFTLYLSGQIAGAGVTLSTVLGIDKIVAMVLVIVVVVLLTRVGGFSTVVWTDALQAMLMLALFIMLPLVLYIQIRSGGINITDSLAAAPAGYNSVTGGLKGFAFIAMFLSNISFIFVYMGGSVQVNSRYMALKNTKDRKEATIIASTWVTIAYLGIFLTGIFAMVLYGDKFMGDPEAMVPFIVVDLLPPALAGLLIAAVMAAIISTADSFLLLVSSTVSEDIVKIGLAKDLSQEQLVKISKYTILLFGLMGFIIALFSESLIFTIINWYIGGLGIPLSAVVTLTFFWKKMTGKGAVGGLIVGIITSFIYSLTGLEAVISLRLTNFVVTLIACIIISLLTKDEVNEIAGETN